MDNTTILCQCGECGATFEISRATAERLDQDVLDEIARAAYAFHQTQCGGVGPAMKHPKGWATLLFRTYRARAIFWVVIGLAYGVGLAAAWHYYGPMR